MGQAPDDLAAPLLLGLAVEDVPADLPVEPEQSGVDRQRGALLGVVDAALEVGQQYEGVTTKLFDRLPDATWVYPGHGNDTTLGAERPHLAEWRERGW